MIYHTFDFNPEILFHSFIHCITLLIYCHRITMHFFRLLFIVYENWIIIIIIIDKKVTIIDQFIIDPNWIIYMVFIFFFFHCVGAMVVIIYEQQQQHRIAFHFMKWWFWPQQHTSRTFPIKMDWWFNPVFFFIPCPFWMWNNNNAHFQSNFFYLSAILIQLYIIIIIIIQMDSNHPHDQLIWCLYVMMSVEVSCQLIMKSILFACPLIYHHTVFSIRFAHLIRPFYVHIWNSNNKHIRISWFYLKSMKKNNLWPYHDDQWMNEDV